MAEMVDWIVSYLRLYRGIICTEGIGYVLGIDLFFFSDWRKKIGNGYFNLCF